MDGKKQKPAAIRFSRNIGNQDPTLNIPEISIYLRLFLSYIRHILGILDFSCHNLDTCVRINVSLYWITFLSFLSVFYFGFPLQKILSGTFSQTNAGRVCLGKEWFKFEHKWTGFEKKWSHQIFRKTRWEKRKTWSRELSEGRDLKSFIQIFARQVW